ncbi:MAG: RecX family transcriptional regulator [Saprospiraceae bacterium]|nr:RecX family transcriptional regulator [Saprospiraceae bacterium]MBK9993916.1 RecX family transcriptional regulator [Saprospiraceae bacterium]
MKHYCAYQERCQKEVEEKLRELKVDQDMADEIMLSLIHENFVKEERYAKAIARGKFRINQWGKVKIKMLLRNSRITTNLIELAMQEIDSIEYQNTIKELYLKKFNSFVKETASVKKQKTIQYLIQKGYEFHDILPVLEGIATQD